MIQSPLPDIDLTDVRSVSMMIRSLRFQIKVTDHTSLTRSLVSLDTRPPSTVPSIAQPDKGIGSNQVYALDIAVASTSISDGIERAPNRLRVKSLIRTGSLGISTGHENSISASDFLENTCQTVSGQNDSVLFRRSHSQGVSTGHENYIVYFSK